MYLLIVFLNLLRKFDPFNLNGWEILQDEIEFKSHLKTNQIVYYGKWKNTIEVFVKSLPEKWMITHVFLEEVARIRTLRQERFVAFYGIYRTEETSYIVQEYMCKGSLLDFLIREKDKKLKVEELVNIAYQIASGMEYLEFRQLIHRDLTVRRILMGENNVAKISCFDLDYAVKDNKKTFAQFSIYPIKWMAPELLVFEKFSIKSDVWSFGILLMELFTYGQIPYHDMTKGKVAYWVERGYRMSKPTDYYVPDKVYRIMLECWHRDPKNRPTFEFLAHCFDTQEVLD